MKNTGTRIFVFFLALLIFNPEIRELSAAPLDITSDSEITERMQFINTALATDEVPSRVWYWSFLGLYTAGTIAQLSLYFAAPSIKSDPLELEYFRQDMMTGVITTAIGAVGLAIIPMTSMYARDSYSHMPENTQDEKNIKLRKAEEMLQTSASWERDNSSLLLHGLNLGVNLTAGLVIWLAFQRTFLDGLITFLPGFAIGEIQILTQPVRSIKSWENFQNKYSRKVSRMMDRDDLSDLHLAAIPGGLMIVREF